jgi:Mg-chelatase subunit ChlD
MSTTKQKEANDAAKDAASRTKTRKGRTYEVIIVDESGSMLNLRESVVTGVNEFVNAFKDTKRVRFVVAWFDWNPGTPMIRYKIDNVRARDVQPLTAADYNPRGGTPLFDTILEVVAKLDGMVEDGDGVDVTIITDGKNNKGEATASAVAQCIEAHEKKGWSFTYMGTKVNAEAVAAEMGMRKRGKAFNFDANPEAMRGTFRSAAGMSASYHSDGLAGREAHASATYAATGGKLGDDQQEPAEKK